MSPLIQHFWIPSFWLKCVKITFLICEIVPNFLKSIKVQIVYQNSIEKETHIPCGLQKSHVTSDPCNKIICRDNWLTQFFFDNFCMFILVWLIFNDFTYLYAIMLFSDKNIAIWLSKIRCQWWMNWTSKWVAEADKAWFGVADKGYWLFDWYHLKNATFCVTKAMSMSILC